MKYKVIFQRTQGSSSSGLAEASFYIKSQAIAAAEGWRETNAAHTAYVWDGSTWTTYAPIP